MPTFKELFEKMENLETRICELESERDYWKSRSKDKVPAPWEINQKNTDNPEFDFKRMSDR